MDNISMTVIGVIALIVIGAAIALNHYRKQNMIKLFDQVFESSKQVPKQKKNSFLLLMFMEAIAASKNKSKSAASVNKLNNPKYLEVQLLQMSKILKNGPKGQDKKTKQALRLLKDYLAWEEAKNSKNAQTKQNKTA